MGYHLISVEPLIKITGLDGPVIRILTGIFIGKYHSVCGAVSALFTLGPCRLVIEIH